MNLPRFQVRTLLVVTTVAALVVATLAPWLRLVTEEIAEGIAKRAIALASGAIIVLLHHFIFKYLLQSKTPVGETLFVVRRSKFQEPTTASLVGLLTCVTSLFLLEFVAHQTSSQSKMLFYVMMFFWGVISVLIAQSGLSFLRSLTPVAMTSEALVGFDVRPWRRLRAFWWASKDAGCLILEFYPHTKGIYFTRPIESEIEAIDVFLHKKLAANKPYPLD